MPRVVDPGGALAAGLRALAECEWEAARASLEAAVREHEAPEALEGLSWAAWWLDDAAAVFDARERAYRLYRQRGDVPSAARMAIWLAIDNLDFNGAMAVAAGWLGRAARLLEREHPSAEHGWLAFQEGYLAHLAGDSGIARQRARAAADIGRRFGVADLEILGLALEGAAMVASAEIADGMRCLDEASATALAGEATIPISGAWALCFLVTACLDVRDYRRAFEWSDRIAEFAERHRSRYMLAFCRSHYGAVHLSRGRWTDAEAELVAAADAYERSRPPMVGDALVWLAELRRRQGRLDDAETILERVGDLLAALVSRGRVALDRGDPGRAMELAERCIRQLPDTNRVEAVPALELFVRAAAAHGEVDRAERAMTELRALVDRIGTAAVRAAASAAEGILAAARCDHQNARRRLEDAVGAFEREGTVFEALTSRVDLAATLAALHRLEDAEREGRAALNGLEALGADREAERARGLLEPGTDSARGRTTPAAITRREREVLLLVAEGLTNRQIAKRLVVSEHTVHRHMTNLLRKLEVPSRSAAAAFAARAGLLAGREG